MRRFRVAAAGWLNTPSAPRASLRLRFKALPLAPGVSTTIAVLMRPLEGGLLKGSVTIAADDGELLTVRFLAHALAVEDFDCVRAAVAECSGLSPLVTATARIEAMAEEWDAEYARQGVVDPRKPQRANPELLTEEEGSADALVEAEGGAALPASSIVCASGDSAEAEERDGSAAQLPVLPPSPTAGLLATALAAGTTPHQVLDSIVSAQQSGDARTAPSLSSPLLAAPLAACVLDGVTVIIAEGNNVERTPFVRRVESAAVNTLALQHRVGRAGEVARVGTPAGADAAAAAVAPPSPPRSPGWAGSSSEGGVKGNALLRTEDFLMPCGGSHHLLVPLLAAQ